MRALADRGQASLGDALLHERGHDGLGARLAEPVVDGVGAGGVAVALDFEIEARVLLHQLRDAVDLDIRFRLDGGLAGVEGDGVGHDLAVGGQAVIERHGALRQADIGDAAVDIIATMVEPEAPGGQGQGDVDHPHAIDIPLEGPLVE